jgi:hypothetical protein
MLAQSLVVAAHLTILAGALSAQDETVVDQVRLAAQIRSIGGRVETTDEGSILAVYWPDRVFGGDKARIQPELLRQLARLPDLRTLDLSYTDLKDEHLRGLSGFESLETLKLSYTQVGRKKIAMKAFHKCNKLRELRLFDTEISAKALEMIPGDEATKVVLRGPNVDDAALQVVSKWPKTRHLSVGGKKITDQGLRHLGKLREPYRIELEAPNTTWDGRVWLIRRFPETEIWITKRTEKPGTTEDSPPGSDSR